MPKFLRTQLIPAVSKIKDIASTREWAEKITAFLDATFRKIADIPFNQSGSLTVADSGTANVEFSFTHHLGRTPAGFIVTKSDAACSVYDSGTTWTTTTIYLKCDAANVALTITVF